MGRWVSTNMKITAEDEAAWIEEDRRQLEANVKWGACCSCGQVECLCPCLYGGFNKVDGIVQTFCLDSVCETQGEKCLSLEEVGRMK